MTEGARGPGAPDGGDGGGEGGGEGGGPGGDRPGTAEWATLDRDLKRIGRLEHAALFVSRPLAATGLALAFLILSGLAAGAAFGISAGGLAVIAGAVFAGYLALSIGANDVANNMGPAVGARALTMGGALVLAALCETAGALLAGGDVVETVAGGILDRGALAAPEHFLWAMLAALIAAAAWVSVATRLGAPVSTTHSVVGAVLGAGLAAAGPGAANWPVLGAIAAGWVVSPLMGGAVAALFLAFVKTRIIYVEDRIAAARRWLPALIGVMAGAFAAYLAVKGVLDAVGLGAGLGGGAALGLGVGAAAWAASAPLIARQARGMENRNRSLKRLFAAPLAVAAALLSFAHGANDVANAVGPLAGIVQAVRSGGVAAQAEAPLWALAIGALGISLGLLLFGPRLVRLVGAEITRLNPMRAWCVALSAAVTVLLASALGLPVSSTHVAVGGVFGVGFFREWWTARRRGGAPAGTGGMAAEERRRRRLVRRSHFLTVLAAWAVTAPAAAAMSAALYLALRALLG